MARELPLLDPGGEAFGKDPDADCNQVCPELRTMGFEPGWGKDVRRMRETMQLLLDILEAPAPGSLEQFLQNIPMIFSIAILSPHGWFGQSDVLGRPDTGGQVVYILDQVRALEKEMRGRLHEQGVDYEPQILVVTRLIPDSPGTTCGSSSSRTASACAPVTTTARSRTGICAPIATTG